MANYKNFFISDSSYASKAANGTSFFGTEFRCTIKDLMDFFEGYDGIYYEPLDVNEKVQFELVVVDKTKDVVGTIYLWKEYDKLNEETLYDFHIGGFNLNDTEYIRDILKNNIK